MKSKVMDFSSSLKMCMFIPSLKSTQRRTDLIDSLKLMSPELAFRLEFLDSKSIDDVTVKGCNVFVSVIDVTVTMNERNGNKSISDSIEYPCPGQCSPIPFASLPYDFFLFQGSSSNSSSSRSSNNDFRVTCSLTTSMVLTSMEASMAQSGSKITSKDWIRVLLNEVFWRRIMECYEGKIWMAAYEKSNYKRSDDLLLMHNEDRRWYRGKLNFSSDTFYQSKGRGHFSISIERRVVKSLVIWIGSRHNLDLIKQQMSTLSEESVHGVGAVVEWAATDECFPCNSNARCTGPGNFKYKYLPGSNMKYAKAGWACAQRRPLRALAHTLRLFDPDFAVVLDDDTFLNYKLLVIRFSSFIRVDSTRPLVMGEFRGKQGDEGHLTKQGILVGGSGYILNKQILDSLVSYKLHFFPLNGSTVSLSNQSASHRLASGPPTAPEEVESDEYRSNLQIHYLSVANEGVAASKDSCSVKAGINSCTLLNRPLRVHRKKGMGVQANSLAYPLAVPVIEFCANLLAHENTCQHSDHSLGRCLFYAPHPPPIPVSAVCHSRVSTPVPASVSIGMCFITPTCNLSEQVTCHRYKPPTLLGDQRSAVRVTRDKGHYQFYSSWFDGKTTDSN
jgi:hypothetical protein